MDFSGEFIRPKEVRKQYPKDGVHRKTKRGFVAHPTLMILDGNLIFVGKDCFYMRLNEDRGIKVYYSLVDKKFRDARFVEDSRKMSDALILKGYMKSNVEIIKVNLNTDRVVGSGSGMIVGHVNVPMSAWVRYCLGYPYDWNDVTDKKHSPEGFKNFTKDINYHNDISLKLGDVGYCTKDKRWYLLDGNKNV